MITRSFEREKWHRTLRRGGYRFENIIGQDPAMFEIFHKITDVAKTTTTVLITGETGTGKELIAEAIHFRSPRREGPLAKRSGREIFSPV